MIHSITEATKARSIMDRFVVQNVEAGASIARVQKIDRTAFGVRKPHAGILATVLYSPRLLALARHSFEKI